jgi:hypothetical protein
LAFQLVHDALLVNPKFTCRNIYRESMKLNSERLLVVKAIGASESGKAEG